jgi:hypothetical protein
MASSSSLLRGSVVDMSAPASTSVDGDEHRFSVTDAAFALAKCIVGAGCFVLPGAVKQAGLWLVRARARACLRSTVPTECLHAPSTIATRADLSSPPHFARITRSSFSI